MARLRVNANQYRIIATLTRLQRRGVLERVGRHHPIVVVGSCDQRRRIAGSLLDVVYRRISVERFELLRILARAVVRFPRRTDGELVKAQHVHHACLLNHRLEQLGTLIRNRAHQQTAVRDAVNREPAR